MFRGCSCSSFGIPGSAQTNFPPCLKLPLLQWQPSLPVNSVHVSRFSSGGFRRMGLYSFVLPTMNLSYTSITLSDHIVQQVSVSLNLHPNQLKVVFGWVRPFLLVTKSPVILLWPCWGGNLMIIHKSHAVPPTPDESDVVTLPGFENR